VALFVITDVCNADYVGSSYFCANWMKFNPKDLRLSWPISNLSNKHFELVNVNSESIIGPFYSF